MECKRNAAPIQEVTKQVIYSEKWSQYFQNFSFQTRFYGDDEYKYLLERVGLKAKRVELIPREMIHQGKEGLKGWIRTTGTASYIGNVPDNLKQQIIQKIADTYIKNYPLDREGFVRIPMVRLEVEAKKL